MDGNHHTPAEANVTDLRVHQRTFAGFVRFLAWLFGLSLLALVFIALANA